MSSAVDLMWPFHNEDKKAVKWLTKTFKCIDMTWKTPLKAAYYNLNFVLPAD